MSDAASWHWGRADEEILRELIQRHFRYTGSFRAKAILENWAPMRGLFIKVMPLEYRKALANMAGQAVAAATQRLAA
jgi:glutamate synthase (NADPH/NADH) large chain